MSDIHYQISALDAHAHLWQVVLSIAKPARGQVVSLPVWIPGSYMVRELSKHLQNLKASQNGQVIQSKQLDKASWKLLVYKPAPIELSYEIYAFDTSVRTSWLDASRGFFNPTSLCLRVVGQENKPHELQINAINKEADPAVSTGGKHLKTSKKGFGSYLFDDYDALADTPFEISASWRGKFKVRGALHEIIVSGAPPSFDGERLLADTKKIVETEMQFWHGSNEKTGKPPFERYVFLLNVVDEGFGGLEHSNSTALICGRRDLPHLGESKLTEGYTTLLGLISHEYFHTWNVKRLKPKEFLRYDYQSENYTRMLWFFEGFTSYYDDLLLRRSGLLDDAQYLRLLTKTINQVQQTPGRFVQSAAASSMDAWVKYYRTDENSPNATVSYYTKGALIALCFDLSLREYGKSLDEVMRWLWTHSKAGLRGKGGIEEADIMQAFRAVGGRAFAKTLDRMFSEWIFGTQELPVADLLEKNGITMQAEPLEKTPWAQRLGLRVNESPNSANASITIKTVLRGGLAEQAGLAAGDEWLAVNDWRIYQLADLPLYAGQAKQVRITVARDKKILHLSLQLASDHEQPQSYQLRISDAALARRWLSGASNA